MKTIEELNREIDKIKLELKQSPQSKASKAKAIKRIAFIRECIMYLKSQPRPEFVKSE
jgi:Mg2+ and Co2+ transporter CorA